MAVQMEEIERVVCLQLGLRNISAGDRFMEDLGAESVDLVNIIATSEDKFNISFDEADISKVRTVQQLYDLINKLSGIQGDLASVL